jgi:hypothetical protein
LTDIIFEEALVDAGSFSTIDESIGRVVAHENIVRIARIDRMFMFM